MASGLVYRRVEAPANCVCGGSLLGLEGAERCPECRRLAAEAPWGKLWNGDLQWLRGLKDACVWFTFGHMMAWVMLVACQGAARRVGVEPSHFLDLLPQLPIVVGAWLAAGRGAGMESGVSQRMCVWLRIFAGAFLAVMAACQLWVTLWEVAAPEKHEWWWAMYDPASLLLAMAWCGLVMCLMMRVWHLAGRMGIRGLQVYALVTLVLAVGGNLAGEYRRLVEMAEYPGVAWYWLNGWTLLIEQWGVVVDATGRGMLFSVAVIMWGYLNLALGRYEERPDVVVTDRSMRVRTTYRRSFRGRLVAEA